MISFAVPSSFLSPLLISHHVKVKAKWIEGNCESSNFSIIWLPVKERPIEANKFSSEPQQIERGLIGSFGVLNLILNGKQRAKSLSSSLVFRLHPMQSLSALKRPLHWNGLFQSLPLSESLIVFKFNPSSASPFRFTIVQLNCSVILFSIPIAFINLDDSEMKPLVFLVLLSLCCSSAFQWIFHEKISGVFEMMFSSFCNYKSTGFQNWL